MIEWDPSRGDVYARGNVMALGNILAALVRMLIANGTLRADEVETALKDISDMFNQPLATDHQLVAAAKTLAILENVLQAPP
jgi:hypothetical protein